MNNKNNTNMQAQWIKKLDYMIYDKPSIFYCNDSYLYGSEMDSGSITSNEQSIFRDEATKKETIKRYSFFLNAQEKKYISIIISLNFKGKVWFNHRLIDICQTSSQVLIVPLKKGRNRIDLDAYSPKEAVVFRIRVEDVINEGMMSAGDEENLGLKMNIMGIYMERYCYLNDKDPKFLLLPWNQKLYSYNTRLTMRLTDHKTGKLVLKRNLHFGKLYRIPREKLVYDPYCMNHLDMTVTCRTRYGEIHTICRSVYNDDFDKYLPELIGKARREMQSVGFSKTRRNGIISSLIERIEEFSDDRYERFCYSEMLKDIVENPKAGTEDDMYGVGVNRVYFYDCLDDTYNYCTVTLPEGFDLNREYALLLVCSTGQYSSYGQYLKNSNFNDVISVDVSVRGITLGGYIGETAILNTLAFIQSSYRIDPNRIYISGYSNGASAALAVAQAYPHLFAGVYALSGRAENNKMCNISNLYTVLITSRDDNYYEHSIELAKANGDVQKKLELLILDKHNHPTIQRVWLNNKYLSKLFKNERDPYPTRFTYVTDRERHLQAYWVRLHGIKVSAKFCKLVVDSGRSIIDISVRGAIGLTIDIPPFINRENFTISINGKAMEFKNVTSDQLHFVHSSKGYRMSAVPAISELRCKGNGLIDVYMDPLCIVIPENASEVVKETAKSMSRPCSNGRNPRIGVLYKTYPLSEFLSKEKFFDNSMIVIGKDKSSFYQKLDELCPIKTNKMGYLYNDELVETSYCCMQIIPNPWNRSKHILYIMYNDEKLLQKNIFTRRMVLPSYIMGRHQYLNELALVFDGENYLVIKTPDGPLEMVKEPKK